MSRKLKKKFNWKKLNDLCAKSMKLMDCADILECSEDTIERYIRAEFDMTFAEYRDKKMSGTRLRLVEKAFELADKGNVVILIFCLKNLCGWMDKIENEESSKLTKDLIIEKINGDKEILKVE